VLVGLKMTSHFPLKFIKGVGLLGVGFILRCVGFIFRVFDGFS
jgi:hypothetical protein